MVEFSRSSSRILFKREVLITTELLALPGMAPPQSPVLPPCGTTAIFSALHNASNDATSSVFFGLRTAKASPVYRLFQSVKKGLLSASDRYTYSVPTIF